MSDKPLWHWQAKAVNDTVNLLEKGELSICITSPTGMGKGRIIEELSKHYICLGGRVGLLTNRKMLTGQTGSRFRDAGIHFGYVAAQYGSNAELPMTIASVQTITSRVKREVMDLPKWDLLLIDEAHNCGFDDLSSLYLSTHPQSAIVGLTATPVGLKGKYKHLVVAGTKREGRAAGALVPCRVIAPSEPDMGGVTMNKIGEYVHEGAVKRVMQCTAFADVFEAWRLNATDDYGSVRPTFLWAPGVPESRWFADQFRELGVTAAHIDADTPESERLRIQEGSKDGSIQVVCSFGVLREGVDWPWISYGILVQACGAIQTYLQTVGRILRAYPGKKDAVLQDHAGAWWRHGSPNADVDWDLGDTNQSIAKERKKSLQKGDKQEGICCPKCHMVRSSGSKCPACGYEHTKSVRMVRMTDGRLVPMMGDVVKRKKHVSDDQKLWTNCLYRCARSGKTLIQAAGLFHKLSGRLLPMECTPRPLEVTDWERGCGDVYGFLVRRRKAKK